jgi:hypothetical protein
MKHIKLTPIRAKKSTPCWQPPTSTSWNTALVTGRYRFRLALGDVSKHAEIVKYLLKQGYDRRNAQ